MLRSMQRVAVYALLGSWVVACGSEDGATGDGTGASAGVSGSAGSGAGGSAGSSGAAGSSGNGGASGSAGAAGEAGGGGTSGAAGGGGTGGSAGTSGSGGTAGGSASVVKIIALGDTGEGNPEQNAVADRMSEQCRKVGGCDAVMLLGDNFYDHGVQSTGDAQWVPKFEQPYARTHLEGVPFYVTLGNHDYGLTSRGDRQAQVDYTFLPVGTGPGTRRSNKWNLPAPYYDVRVGDVHLFSIDSQDYGATQRNDMRGRVQRSTATWKLVYGHHPRYTSGEHGAFYDNPVLGAAGMFALIDGISCPADFYVSGHDHNVEFIDKGQNSACPNTYYAISGAGAKVRSSSGVPKVGRQLYYNERIESFAYLEFRGRSLLWQFIDSSGTVIWEKTITK